MPNLGRFGKNTFPSKLLLQQVCITSSVAIGSAKFDKVSLLLPIQLERTNKSCRNSAFDLVKYFNSKDP